MGNTFTTTEASGSGYAGRYTSETQVQRFLDSFNLTAYADLDNDGARDSGVVQQAIDTAEGRVDFYTGGPYTFSEDTNGTVAASNFERWARVLAVWELFAKRIPVTSDLAKELARQVKEAIDEMKMFAGGEMLLPGAIPDNGPPQEDVFNFDAPIAVGPTVNPDGTTLNECPRLTIDKGRLNYG